MLRNCLCALAGGYSLRFFDCLPQDSWLLAALALASVGLCCRKSRLAGFFLLGLSLVWISSRAVILDRLSPELQGQTLVLVARVLDFPDARSEPLRFVVATDKGSELPARIRLSWYDAAAVPKIGETWQLQVRLRRPRGFSNPARFDYEHWLFRKRIGATGYVVNGEANVQKSDIAVDRLSALRQRLVDRMTTLLGHNDATAVLMAVTVGATQEISKSQWERYAASGTSHVMAISGMNIAMAAGGAYVLAWLILSAFCRRTNIRDLAALAAVATAILYAEISGFAIPARRAMLMALLVMTAGLLRRQLFASRLFAICCMIVMVTDPLAIHAPGFKLSFAAVAILFWSARQQGGAAACDRSSVPRKIVYGITRLTALQFALLLGLLPLTALLFGRIAWLAPLVNMLVLPVFDLVTVPASLLGLLLDGPFQFAGDWLLRIAWYSVRLTLWLIARVADWPPAQLHIAGIAGPMLLVALLPAAWAVLPPGFPGRRLAWVAAIAAVLHNPPAPPPDCLELTALDVGQGLSLVLRTHTRTIVYDTGPSFRSGSDTGALVVVPYLRMIAANRVDLLVVSHADRDHAGGVGSLLEAIDVSEIIVGERLTDVDRRQVHCRRGQAWLWDGVRFAFMHPGDVSRTTDNNASCVLEIAVGRYKLLLTGDIEALVEDDLVQNGAVTPVDIVVVPHHGSRTSSSSRFVASLNPEVAIVSAGFDNRWRLPKEDVVLRWQAVGARVLNTATSGAIRYRLCPDTGTSLIGRHRIRYRRYWHDP